MSGRRRESRLEMVDAEGVIKVLRDVMVRRGDGREFVARSSEPGVAGEILTIQFASDGYGPVPVRVVASEPILRDGALQHQLRLTTLDREPSAPIGGAQVADRRGE
jgi:hypothetical protein